MKEPFSMEPGRVVESTQGRDKGKYFLFVDIDPERALVAQKEIHRNRRNVNR